MAKVSNKFKFEMIRSRLRNYYDNDQSFKGIKLNKLTKRQLVALVGLLYDKLGVYRDDNNT